MYYEKHRPASRRTGRRNARRAFLSALLFLALCFGYVNIRADALIAPAVEAGASSDLTRAVNAAVNEVLSEEGLGQPVRLSVAEDGTVTALETDAACVNRIRAAVSAAAVDALSEDVCRVPVPIGSLTGLPLLAGRGPEIQLRLRPAGACTSELYGSLQQAGVNQTRHTVTCVVRAKMYAMLPGRSVPVELSADVLLAESVIVGRVPGSYTYVVGDRSDTISRIFDYADTGD